MYIKGGEEKTRILARNPSAAAAAGVGSVTRCDAVNRHPAGDDDFGSVAAVLSTRMCSSSHIYGHQSSLQTKGVRQAPSRARRARSPNRSWLLSCIICFRSRRPSSPLLTDNKPTNNTVIQGTKYPGSVASNNHIYLLTNHCSWIDHYTPTNHNHIHIYPPPWLPTSSLSLSCWTPR